MSTPPVSRSRITPECTEHLPNQTRRDSTSSPSASVKNPLLTQLDQRPARFASSEATGAQTNAELTPAAAARKKRAEEMANMQQAFAEAFASESSAVVLTTARARSLVSGGPIDFPVQARRRLLDMFPSLKTQDDCRDLQEELAQLEENHEITHAVCQHFSDCLMNFIRTLGETNALAGLSREQVWNKVVDNGDPNGIMHWFGQPGIELYLRADEALNKFLLEQAASVFAGLPPARRQDALDFLSARGESALSLRIAEGLDVVSGVDGDSRSALHHAALNGNARLIEVLAQKERKLIDEPDAGGSTPLILASLMGHVGVIDSLLARNADIEKKDATGFTALIAAADCGHKEAVEHLLAANANVDERNGEGLNALMIAAYRGYADIIEPLLAAGAKIDEMDPHGATALKFAAGRGHEGVIEQLIAWNADIDKKSADGVAALYLATEFGHVGAIRRLVKAGASVDDESLDGFTPLMLAAEKDNPDAIDLLVDAKADVNKMTAQGTALMVAAMHGSTKAIARLLELGADRDMQALRGLTALKLAEQEGHVDAVNLLRSPA